MPPRPLLPLLVCALLAAAGDEPRTWAQRTGSFFAPPPADPFAPPDIEAIALPELEGDRAIWGATGRDDRGHVWVGVSGGKSAHLFEYVPDTGAVVPRGDVVSELERSGLRREGETQRKIHSRILQADDGFLYFASSGEEGEARDGSRPPTWGSHVWRLKPAGGPWEHLFAAPEGMVAAAAGGRFIYTLGYFGHVLYQYDTRTGKHRSTKVGSVGGHVSRNFLATPDGHAFVPAVARTEDGTIAASLVEYDAELRVLNVTPLEGYLEGRPEEAHGITGVTYLAHGAMAFTTGRGTLFRVDPREGQAARVTSLGTFFPDLESYAASLFPFDGERYLAGPARAPKQGYKWIVYDLQTGESVRRHLESDELHGDYDLYGSITRDNRGAFYVVGYRDHGPLFLRFRVD